MEMKKVRTVLGDVSPSELGVVLPHEHILVDFMKGIVPHTLPDGRNLSNLNLTLSNMGLIRRYPYSVGENLVLNETEKAKYELELFKSSGGRAICEMSVVGLRRDDHTHNDLVNISMATGVHIISATGFYCHKFLPEWVCEASVRKIADHMTKEIVEGVGSSGVRCGVMYLGCSQPLKEVERRTLIAASMTHKETGVSLAIHPGRDPLSFETTLDYLVSNGVPSDAVSMSHVDRTYTDSQDDIKKMAKLCLRGCYINHSLFGKECSHYQYDLSFDMPSDAQRIKRVKGLIHGGCVDRLMISQDVVCRSDMTSYGGHGYSHIVENIAPKLTDRGVEEEIVETIIKTNPQNWLSF